MGAQTIDYSAILKDLPPGTWVAISEAKNEIVAYAADLHTALESARQKGEQEPLILRVPEYTGMLFL